MVGRAPAVLILRDRLLAGSALGAAVGCYYAWSSSLWNASTWWDVAWVSLVRRLCVVYAYGIGRRTLCENER